jgi:hypothetical protein
MKEEKKLIENKFQLVKDSVKILSNVVSLQNELISNKDKEIELLKKNEESHKGLIKEKDAQIVEYKKVIRKQKTFKFMGLGVGTIGLAAVVLILL